MPKHCSSGPIVTAKANTSAPRSNRRHWKAIKDLMSNELDSATQRDCEYCAPEQNPCKPVAQGSYSHVIQAAQRPINLDDRQVNAVSARIELDLRLGAAFTRYQTRSLQALGGDLADRVLSYGSWTNIKSFAIMLIKLIGSCQFPTLGFVVDRYFRVKNFVPEKFWSIKVMQLRDNIKVRFSWRRNRLFDRASVVLFFERCIAARLAKVSKMQRRLTSKWRPLPLTTVELQKLGSMYLRMDSQKVMKVREVIAKLPSPILTRARLLRSSIIKAGSATHVQRPINSTKAWTYEGSLRNTLRTHHGVHMLRGKAYHIPNEDPSSCSRDLLPAL